MASVIQTNFRLRKTFARLTEAVEIPNLIDIQKRSFDLFLQSDKLLPKKGEISAYRASLSLYSPSRISTRPARWNSSTIGLSGRSTTLRSAWPEA